jgi:hypothetical protein
MLKKLMSFLGLEGEDAEKEFWLALGKSIKAAVEAAVNGDAEKVSARITALIELLAPATSREEIEATSEKDLLIALAKMCYAFPVAMEFLCTPDDELQSEELQQRLKEIADTFTKRREEKGNEIEQHKEE